MSFEQNSNPSDHPSHQPDTGNHDAPVVRLRLPLRGAEPVCGDAAALPTTYPMITRAVTEQPAEALAPPVKEPVSTKSYIIPHKLPGSIVRPFVNVEPDGKPIDDEYYMATIGSRPPHPYEVEQQHKRNIESGNVPGAGNGYFFAIDHRPEGQEDDYIHATEYTAYFAVRKIPIAAPDHKLFQHDLGHIASYQRLFSNEAVADLVQTAAQKSLSEEAFCHMFTDAMDGLGDCMRNIMNDKAWGRQIYIGDVNGALNGLRDLICLKQGRPAESVLSVSEHKESVALERQLGLHHFRRFATLHRGSYAEPMLREYDY
jgi:hypothetical protein